MPKSSRRFSIISFLIYGAVVVLLIYLALFSRGFSETLADIRLSGRYAPFPPFVSKKIQDLTISYKGLDLKFSQARPLTLFKPDGGIQSFALDSFRSHSDGAEILFEGGTTLHLSPADGADSSHLLTVALARGLSGTASLVIPFHVKGALKNTAGVPVLSWGGGENGCMLSLSGGSKIDFDSGVIVLETLRGEKQASIRFGAGGSSLLDPYASWLSREATFASPEAFQSEFLAFARAAYMGWSRTRLSPDGALWRDSSGAYVFREETGQALLAESIFQGTYQRQRALSQEALAGQLRQFPDKPFSLSSSPFTGNLKEYARRLSTRESMEVETLRARLAVSDASFLGKTRGIVPFILDHGPFSLVEDTFSFLQDLDRTEPGGIEADVGAAEALLDYAAFVGNSEAALAQCRRMIERRILPAIKETDKGILLESRSPGRIDVASTIRAAGLLMRAGAALDLPVLGSIGRSLAVSALGLRDDSGFLPAAVGLSLDRVVSRDGALAPEDVYADIAQGRYLPKETPLFKSLGPGCWIWTAAKVDGVEAAQATLRLSLSFPVGLPHYLLIQGVKPFSKIALHETPWRPDPDYSQYGDGYWYDAQSRTLFMKLTGRKEKEEIAIDY